jgi:hypothetical protein
LKTIKSWSRKNDTEIPESFLDAMPVFFLASRRRRE